MIRLFLLRLLDTYFRHRWLWLAPVVIMAAFGGVQFMLARPSYISVAAVYVNKDSLLASLTSIREDGFSWVTPAQATVDQIKELLQTDAFIRSVIQLSDLEARMAEGPQSVSDTIQEARKAIWVNVLGKNTIVIGAVHEQAAVAQQLADGAIQVYLLWKINTNKDQTTAATGFFQNLVETYRNDVQVIEDELRIYLDGHPAPVRGERPPAETIEIDRLEKELALASDRYKKALDNLEAAQLSSAVNESNVRETYLLLDAPRLPLKASQSTSSKLMNVLVFVVVGVVLSAGGVVAGTILDNAVRFPEDIRYALELPLLTSLPPIEQPGGKRRPAGKRKPEA